MLIGKISPYVKFSVKEDLLNDPSTVEAKWVTVTAERMPLGADEVRFSFFLGFTNEVGIDIYRFTTLYRDSMTFLKADLSDWGTDDSVMIYKIATRLGLQITEVLDVNITDMY